MTVDDYARQHGLTHAEAVNRLVLLALDQLEARARGGRTTASRADADTRQTRARAAAVARWTRRPARAGDEP